MGFWGILKQTFQWENAMWKFSRKTNAGSDFGSFARMTNKPDSSGKYLISQTNATHNIIDITGSQMLSFFCQIQFIDNFMVQWIIFCSLCVRFTVRVYSTDQWNDCLVFGDHISAKCDYKMRNAKLSQVNPVRMDSKQTLCYVNM